MTTPAKDRFLETVSKIPGQAKNALLDVVQNRGLEAFTDCPWREILLNAANAKPFMELGSYLRSPGPGGHNIRRWITPASGSK